MSRTFVVHYMAECEDGPIRTSHREVEQDGRSAVVCRGGSYAISCDPKRKHLARVDSRGKVQEWFFASGHLPAVTCPKCVASPLYQRDAEILESHKKEAV